MDKQAIAAVLAEIGSLLELKGENTFKVRAYKSGARALEALDRDLGEVIDAGELAEVHGIGEALTEKIASLHRTGKLVYYEDLKASVPGGLVEMLEIPGLGGKRIKAIHDALGVESIDALQRACLAGEVAALAGFGKKSEEKILTGIANREAYGKRHLWWDAEEVARPILEGLRGLAEVEQAECAGSLRRGVETVGDLDFLVASGEPAAVMEWFVNQEAVAEVTAHGSTKSSVRFRTGLQADLRVVPAKHFAFALHHFTGSKDHNVKMRQRALGRGYSLSEWGLFDKDDEAEPGPGRPAAVEADSEEALFEALGMHFVPPELREGLDEIEAAEAAELPRLLEPGDLRGVFHNHTTASDGHHTLEEMAQAAADLGWDYLGIADHSKSAIQANGLDEGRLARQVEEIRQLNASGRRPVYLFAGSEVDILPDGRLDFDDATLAPLDYVVASVHSSFSQTEEKMTARIIRALEHPAVTFLGHLTGRILLRREGYAVNVPKVIDAAIANGVVIELNANPYRLDMDWRHWKQAAARGLLCAINPDAHSTGALGYYRAGVLAARKGWLGPANVLNTRSRDAVATYFERGELN